MGRKPPAPGQADHVEPGAEGVAGDVLVSIFGDHQDIGLAVAVGAGPTHGDGEHRLHPDHHARLQHRVDVLAQFQPRLAAIVVRQHTEAVAVAEGAVLQEIAFGEEGVDLLGDHGAARPGGQKAHAGFMCGDVGLQGRLRTLRAS